MQVSEICFRYLTGVDYYESPRLREVVNSFLWEQIGCHEVEFWSRVMDPSQPYVFTRILHSVDGIVSTDDERHILTQEELHQRLSSFQVISIQVPIPPVAGSLPSPMHVFAFRHHRVFSSQCLGAIEATLAKLARDGFRANMRRLYESLHGLIPMSKDLTSFFHRCIHSVLIPSFSFEAMSIFYYEAKTDSLILGATTGIERQEELGLKRSDIRYFADGESFTSRSFRSSHDIVEDTYRSGPLKNINQGESVSSLQSRIYMPLTKWDDSLEPAFPSPLGIIRAVNANSDNNCHPITILETARLRVASNVIAGLVDRYMKTLTVLHDQERSTHGYNTDLCTIKYAAENIDRWLLRVLPTKENLNLTAALTEISYRTRDIIAVQDNMASQLMTVMYHSENTSLIGKASDDTNCDFPFKQVFMRLMAAKKGMSDCYGRTELAVKFNGSAKIDEAFMKIPPLSISVGSMYLIVRNVAENSIKYGRKGIRPMLDIRWKREGFVVAFEFRDYGIGIPSRETAHIFRDSFRGRRAQELQLRGNGLGLAVSRSAAEAVGGSLRYLPVPKGEHGSIFELRIPTK